MIIISAMYAQGTDLRPARNTDLVSLVQSQSRHNTELTRRLTALRQEVDGLTARSDEQSDPPGSRSAVSPRWSDTGLRPGSYRDTRRRAVERPANGIEPDLLVVHQEDIQAVVNALWSGGAEAMTIQGQRVISTTAVKCVGNTVVLHGIPYGPPYESARLATRLGCEPPSPSPSRSRFISSTWSPTVWSSARSRSPRSAFRPMRARRAGVCRAVCALRHPKRQRPPALMTLSKNDHVPAVKVLVIDNYDSFVYNLVQYLAQIGAEVDVWRNDDPRFDSPDFRKLSTASCSRRVPERLKRQGYASRWSGPRRVGCPSSASVLGCRPSGWRTGAWSIERQSCCTARPRSFTIRGIGVLAGLPSPFTATRYHSLAIEPPTLPAALEVTATTPSGVIMAIRHRELPIEAVQFHPESVLTEWGYQMLANWLAICGDAEAPARAVGMAPLMSAR